MKKNTLPKVDIEPVRVKRDSAIRKIALYLVALIGLLYGAAALCSVTETPFRQVAVSYMGTIEFFVGVAVILWLLSFLGSSKNNPLIRRLVGLGALSFLVAIVYGIQTGIIFFFLFPSIVLLLVKGIKRLFRRTQSHE